MRTMFTLVVLFFSCSASAWVSETDFTVGVTNGLANPPVLTSCAFTNELSEFICTTSSSSLLLSARLVEVLSHLEEFGQTAEDKSLSAGIALASNCVRRAESVGTPEQVRAAKFILVTALCSAGADGLAFEVSTNALSHVGADEQGQGMENDAILRSILRYHDIPDLGLGDSLRAFAALTAAKCGKTTCATNLVRTLPIRYKTMVSEILGGGSR